MKRPIIIAMTGTSGSGKGTIVELLTEKHQFQHFSFREFLVKEIVARKLPVNRDTMREVGNELRTQHGGEYIAYMLLKEARESGKNAVLESVRAPFEINFFGLESDVSLLAIDAPIKLRYQRVHARGTETDNVTEEEFILQEQKEMENTDPAKQNLRYCINETPIENRIWNDQSVAVLEHKLNIILETVQQQQQTA